jgi:hypothetical protein
MIKMLTIVEDVWNFFWVELGGENWILVGFYGGNEGVPSGIVGKRSHHEEMLKFIRILVSFRKDTPCVRVVGHIIICHVMGSFFIMLKHLSPLWVS